MHFLGEMAVQEPFSGNQDYGDIIVIMVHYHRLS